MKSECEGPRIHRRGTKRGTNLSESRHLRAPDPTGEIADTLPTVSPRLERSRAVLSGMLLACYGEDWLYGAAGGTFRIPVAVCSEPCYCRVSCFQKVLDSTLD